MIDTAGDVAILVAAIKQWGSLKEGKHAVEYGILFDKTANTLEALNGTLRSARRQKIITHEGELLMMPRDKSALVILLVE